MTHQQTERMGPKEFGAVVLDARKRAGLSRREAGELIHTHERQIGKYECGDTAIMPDVAARMAEAYKEPWIETTYCQCVCPMGGCTPAVRIGTELMNSLLQVSMYDESRLTYAVRNVYEIMADGIIDAGERIEFERSQQEIDARLAQLLEVAACARHAMAQSGR